MAEAAYERLSASDTAFLALEDSNASMHVALTAIFDLGPLRAPNGGVDFERIERWFESVLPEVPRYQQKLKWTPFQNHPVWIDDASFNLRYHLRHSSLPHPGTVRQLKRLAARIMSQQLDRKKPLWEAWVIEGLEGDRFAVILKTHHCMVDGASGMELMSRLLSNDPGQTDLPAPPPFLPRSEPSTRELLVGELRRGARVPLESLRGLGNVAREAVSAAFDRDGERASVMGMLHMLRFPAATPLNGPLGPHRRFDWTATDLGAIKAIRRKLGGSVNDVVLATVAGSVRGFLARRGTSASASELDFRVLAPVNVRAPAEAGNLGNRVSAWIIDLPIGVADPRERLEQIVAQTQRLKQANQAALTDALITSTDLLPGGIFAAGARALAHILPFALVVTNVPGPQDPWYLVGAQVLEFYGNVPLAGNLGLGIAVMSYNGKLFWGFNADWEIVPDVHDFVETTATAFGELRAAAGVSSG